MDAPIKMDSLYTVIFSPNYDKELVFRGYTKSFSSFNEEGPFDILPQHENFVSVLKDKIIIVDDQNQKREFAIGKALIEASNNLVKVFVEF